MGRLNCGGGLCVCAVWVCFEAVCAIALAHAVVCRRRRLDSNQIRTIANGAFSGLTALTQLYGAGLWVGVIFGACCLVFAWMLGLISLGLLQTFSSLCH